MKSGKTARILKININNPNPKITNQAADVLTREGLVVYPTDTTYGLGVNACNENAVQKLYKVKNRDPQKPTHIICRDWEMISRFCETNKLAKKLYERYCPGPLTLILKKHKRVKFPKILTGGLLTLGVRVPNCKVTQAISSIVLFPYTTPSANKSGDITPYCIEQVVESLAAEKVDLILDAEELPKQPPSTIVDLSGNNIKIIREGTISVRDIQTTLKNL